MKTLKEIKNDEARARERYYEDNNWPIEAKTDECSIIRFFYLEHHGYTKEDFKDKCPLIRMGAGDSLGYTEDSFEDEQWEIIMLAHRELGHNQSSLLSEIKNIRHEAELYLNKCKKILGINKNKIEFTEGEAMLLKLNGINVSNSAILLDKVR